MSSPASAPGAEIIRRRLISWYDENKRSLPWRETGDPYRIWVSEVMLQQTQVRTVIPYYRAFLRRFPDIFALAEADLQEVLKAWEGLGYYGRVRHLHRAAQRVVADHGGRIPEDPAVFRGLPGVGDYITAAVQSIAFGRPMAVVDGNVKRLLARLFEIDAPVNRPAAYKVFKAVADQLLDTTSPGDFNQAVMELGAVVCRPAKPACDLCPLREACRCLERRSVGAYPKRVKRKPVPEVHIAVGVVRKKGRLLITRRRPDGLLGGLWEFPGGKVKEGETAEAACKRELGEETGLSIHVTGHITRVRHAYTHFRIVMDVYDCAYRSGRVRLNGPVDHCWVAPEGLHRYPFPRANHKFMHLITDVGSVPTAE